MVSLTLLAVLATLCCIQYGTSQTIDVANVRRLTNGIGKFSQNLYTEVSATRPNSIFSPYSAHTALSMAYLGARGDTAVEMKTVLQITKLDDPHRPHGNLIKDLNSVKDVDVLIANSAWYNDIYKVVDDYKNDLARTYDAYVERLVFNSANVKPEEPINKWVANKTEDNIQEIIERGSLSEGTSALILVNTIYFNSNWSSQFSEEATYLGDFRREDGSTVQTDFMAQTGLFDYKASAFQNADLARIPFKNQRFAFYVLLPKPTSRLSDIEKTISQAAYSNPDDWFKDMTETDMAITLPKFKLTTSMELKEPLKKMGMPTAFSDSADFKGITDKGIKISRVVQKAVIDVREAGVTAAVSTAINFTIKKGNTIDFKADHGFVYFVRDDENGNILFQGKFSDPKVTNIEIK